MPGKFPKTRGIPGIPGARPWDPQGRPWDPGHTPGAPRDVPETPGTPLGHPRDAPGTHWGLLGTPYGPQKRSYFTKFTAPEALDCCVRTCLLGAIA